MGYLKKWDYNILKMALLKNGTLEDKIQENVMEIAIVRKPTTTRVL